MQQAVASHALGLPSPQNREPNQTLFFTLPSLGYLATENRPRKRVMISHREGQAGKAQGFDREHSAPVGLHCEAGASQGQALCRGLDDLVAGCSTRRLAQNDACFMPSELTTRSQRGAALSWRELTMPQGGSALPTQESEESLSPSSSPGISK